MSKSQSFLFTLAALWRQEKATSHARFVEERQRWSLRERVERGLALQNLDIIETDAALGGRILLWVCPPNPASLEQFRGGPGTPVRLWFDSPDGPGAVIGTLARRRPERLGIVVDDVDEDLEEGGFHLDRDEPQATFQRGEKAINLFLAAKANDDIGRLREILCGGAAPAFGPPLASPKLFDESLNEPQVAAIVHALAAKDLALIHGPPGTGKTRTLVECIRQAVARGDKVLATAASNAAVDNLAARLAAASVDVVRLGHPARVSAEMEAHTLDARMEQTEEYKLSRKWIVEANAMRRKLNSKSRARVSRQERRDQFREMRSLFRDARQQILSAQKAILARADVICATAAGADVDVLGDTHFGLVVIDEATQATDPIALVPMTRAQRVLMAGDPCQLPPTVIDLDAARAGLGTTFFERLAGQSITPGDQSAADPAAAQLTRLLTVQYRMHETIMRFPSESMYHSRLEADPANASHTLHELPGVAEDPERIGPFILIDSAGKGWEEVRTDDDPSTSNPEQAACTVSEARRILARGLAPENLAVLTPYDAQVRLLRGLLAEERIEGLEIGSIDGFQGREKEAIILDLVRSNDDNVLGFLKDRRRINVALTRARRLLIVIGDSATLGQDPYFGDFLSAAESYGTYLSAWEI